MFCSFHKLKRSVKLFKDSTRLVRQLVQTPLSDCRFFFFPEDQSKTSFSWIPCEKTDFLFLDFCLKEKSWAFYLLLFVKLSQIIFSFIIPWIQTIPPEKQWQFSFGTTTILQQQQQQFPKAKWDNLNYLVFQECNNEMTSPNEL